MTTSSNQKADERPMLLCLAHMNWDHVWQRPQQLMTRLTRHYRVWYVDPPELCAAGTAPILRELGTDQGVRVLRPCFPAELVPLSDGYWAAWHRLLPDLLSQVGELAILWVYSPYAEQLVERATARLSVYDCMDDLASFKDGSADMREREAKLLRLADLVFTGGHSMYQARKDRHPRVHCFPSGVDIAHYQQVHDPATAVVASLARLPQPRLGYIGVLDERIDWGLIAEVAVRRPEWHWTLVGPTAKVDPSELPQAANIHYLGKQPYADLPAVLKGFDLATMPFALNEATRFISPTKTLEYLAGGKRVISSAVPDVVAFYRNIVAVVNGADEWIAATERLLAEELAERQAQLEQVSQVLAASTWDAIVLRMADIIDAQLAQRAENAL
jgi:UDP-galactopyranose mutase